MLPTMLARSGTPAIESYCFRGEMSGEINGVTTSESIYRTPRYVAVCKYGL